VVRYASLELRLQQQAEGGSMKYISTLLVLPLFAGYLFAQDTQKSETTTTTTTTWNGTLLDGGCYTTHTQKTESTSENGSTKTETTKIVTECPVTTTTSTFAMVTPEGRVVRFDEPGNTQVVEMVKTNKEWGTFISEHKPIKVRVVGTSDGDVVVIKEIK
jgi:hypothetical protein